MERSVGSLVRPSSRNFAFERNLTRRSATPPTPAAPRFHDDLFGAESPSPTWALSVWTFLRISACWRLSGGSRSSVSRHEESATDRSPDCSADAAWAASFLSVSEWTSRPQVGQAWNPGATSVPQSAHFIVALFTRALPRGGRADLEGTLE